MVATLNRTPGKGPLPLADPATVLNSLSEAVIVLSGDNRMTFVNHAAEQLLGAGAPMLLGQPLENLTSIDSQLASIVAQCRRYGSSVSDTSVRLEGPRIGAHIVNVRAAPWADDPQSVVLTLHEGSIARQIDRQLTHRNVARSITAMAGMLAHEVKNPLSGIRGAAQLLEDATDDDGRQLIRLICDETDRIVSLVDRMEAFGDDRPPSREALNIHEVLDYVRRLAQSGFARNVRFVELYDPSLPPVFGNRDQLVQVFLNLIKNAAEALPEEHGEIQLGTRYRHGTRLAVPGSGERVDLPLEITVRDNGEGIPEDLLPHLFDPFVTTKQSGSGLGLALVAKTIGDHGGIIDVDSEPRRTIFRVLLPVLPETQEANL